jgi:hypothetical protein
MIEVEKKFRATDEGKTRLMNGAEFVNEKTFTDIYWDTKHKLIDPTVDLVYTVADQAHNISEIHVAFDAVGVSPLKPVFEHLNGRFEYDTLRLARLLYPKGELRSKD